MKKCIDESQKCQKEKAGMDMEKMAASGVDPKEMATRITDKLCELQACDAEFFHCAQKKMHDMSAEGEEKLNCCTPLWDEYKKGLAEELENKWATLDDEGKKKLHDKCFKEDALKFEAGKCGFSGENYEQMWKTAEANYKKSKEAGEISSTQHGAMMTWWKTAAFSFTALCFVLSRQ